ncbi:7486_t:CDS:2 [Ambispora gerdemannii]|uniref:7486_t:CDS:1 n=1 Tax=Ambispora gerdemannii TaxID=144530 RepID=A0A9N9GK05_9GLOM|nr:7486_t:CDS:2 [Ambispora gerdemannii]
MSSIKHANFAKYIHSAKSQIISHQTLEYAIRARRVHASPITIYSVFIYNSRKLENHITSLFGLYRHQYQPQVYCEIEYDE